MVAMAAVGGEGQEHGTRGTEQDLLRRAKDGDASALEATILTYQPLMRSLARRIAYGASRLDQREALEAVGYDALCASVRCFEPMRGVPFGLYVTRAARNAMLRELKREGKHAALSLDAPLLRNGDEGQLATRGDVLPERAPTPEEAAETAALRHALLQAIWELSPPYRAAAIHVLLQEEPASNVASDLCINPDTMRARVMRARAQLRRALRTRGWHP